MNPYALSLHIALFPMADKIAALRQQVLDTTGLRAEAQGMSIMVGASVARVYLLEEIRVLRSRGASGKMRVMDLSGCVISRVTGCDVAHRADLPSDYLWMGIGVPAATAADVDSLARVYRELTKEYGGSA